MALTESNIGPSGWQRKGHCKCITVHKCDCSIRAGDAGGWLIFSIFLVCCSLHLYCVRPEMPVMPVMPKQANRLSISDLTFEQSRPRLVTLVQMASQKHPPKGLLDE